jgi:hypothetical protein
VVYVFAHVWEGGGGGVPGRGLALEVRLSRLWVLVRIASHPRS